MDILNWFNWKKDGRIITSASDDALIAVGELDPKRDDKYLSVAIKKSDLIPTVPKLQSFVNNADVEAVVVTAVAGQMYFDSTLKKAKVYNGVTWEALN